MRKTVSIFLSVLSICLVTLSMAFIIPIFWGYKPYAVISGSMEPYYHVGAIVFAKKVDPSVIKVDDCITFSLGDVVATHRVVAVDKDKREFTTKGDANTAVDEPISFNALIGQTSEYTIPFLGFVSIFLKGVFGKVAIIALGISIILISIVRTFNNKNKKGQVKFE